MRQVEMFTIVQLLPGVFREMVSGYTFSVLKIFYMLNYKLR